MKKSRTSATDRQFRSAIIKSLKSFTYRNSVFFRRVNTPEVECRCRTGRLSTSSPLHTNVRGHEAANYAQQHHGNKHGWVQESCPGGLAACLSEGLVNQPGSRDKGTGTQGEGLSRSGLCCKAFSPLLP